MTLPPPPAAPESRARDEDADQSVSAAALERYQARMRRPRLVYAVAIAVVFVVLLAFGVVVYSRGEAAHTTLHTAAHPPASVGSAAPNAAQQQRWRTSDRLALGAPLAGGTVITYSQHTVRGRDARTGQQTWRYTRTDRSICNVIQTAGTAVAVFAVNGDCDEVNALDAETGKRAWSRTLDEDGVTLNGRATYRWTSGTVLIYSPDAMYAIDPSSGLDRFTYTRYGCQINNAAVGSAGTLISQNCTHPRCSGVKKCGYGQQLVLRSNESKADEAKANYDHFVWNDLGNSDVPLSAGTVVAALNRTTGRIDTYARQGRVNASVALDPAPTLTTATIAEATASDTADGVLVWLGGVAALVQRDQTNATWSAQSAGPPTLSGPDDPPAVASATIAVPVAGGVAELDPATGRARNRFVLSGLGVVGAGTRAYPLSTGFLVATTSATVAYQ